MKKTVLATAVLLAVSISSFANGNDDYKKLFNDFTNAFEKASNVQSPVQWVTTENYKRAAFLFKGKSVFAYFKAENDDLIGFSRPLSVNDLPENALTNIQNRYGDWAITEVTIFLYADGHVRYYAGAIKGKNNIVFEITTKGQIGIFSKMSS